jgi:uncharacterized RDD family membrane protein YckC
MKCPKCGYLGYQDVDRCRNCGYEFSLAGPAPAADLRLRDPEPAPRPLSDLDLVDSAMTRPPADRFVDAGTEPPRAPDPPPARVDELPLFGPPITDDVPLITRPSPPRPPLSVRRATPEVPRLKSEPRVQLQELSVPASVPQASTTATAASLPLKATAADPKEPILPATPRAAAASPSPRREASSEVPELEDASVASRITAGVVDIGLLLLIDLLVVYFALKICRLEPSELSLLPKVPLLAFLLMQNGGYLVAFTATGQTIGKMLAGVRVVASDSASSPDLGRSTLRALLWIVLALPAGLGLLSVMLDGKGLHDRLAGTRVVRARA